MSDKKFLSSIVKLLDDKKIWKKINFFVLFFNNIIYCKLNSVLWTEKQKGFSQPKGGDTIMAKKKAKKKKVTKKKATKKKAAKKKTKKKK